MLDGHYVCLRVWLKRFNDPFVVSLSNHEQCTLRQAQGERSDTGLPATDRISGRNLQGGPLYVPKQQPLPLS